MLEKLWLANFTAFADAEFEFSDGLNVIVGENGTGKTHVLKLAYSVLYAGAGGPMESVYPSPTTAILESAIEIKLFQVFKPNELHHLVRQSPAIDKNGHRDGLDQSASVHCILATGDYDVYFSIKDSKVAMRPPGPAKWLEKRPTYLPPGELLTLCPVFVPLYDSVYLPFDETWRDTCLLLGLPPAKRTREIIDGLLAPLEEAMEGKVVSDQVGRFYLESKGFKLEMHLVSDGLRKLAMIARLIGTGSLASGGFLFWDEPEANLNPKMTKLVARTILHICRSGVQVFIATHSLFLMRELDILLQDEEFKGTKARFFGLHRDYDRAGDAYRHGVSVMQGDTVDDIGDIDALQEELLQSDRFLAVGAVE